MPNANKTQRPGDGSTGPRTSTGKDISSRNAIVHGGRIEKHIILAGESDEEYQNLREEWFLEYKPQTHLEADLIDRLAQRHWAFKRCERRLDQTEAQLATNNPDFMSWTDADHRILQLAIRYRNTAERAYKAARADIDALRKARLNELVVVEKLKRDYHHNVKTGMSGNAVGNLLTDGKPPLTPADMPPGGWFCANPEDDDPDNENPGSENPAAKSVPEALRA